MAPPLQKYNGLSGAVSRSYVVWFLRAGDKVVGRTRVLHVETPDE
jgi:hypothetical protein